VRLREIVSVAIDAAIQRNGGNLVAAARDLGIGKTTLYRRWNAKRFYLSRHPLVLPLCPLCVTESLERTANGYQCPGCKAVVFPKERTA